MSEPASQAEQGPIDLPTGKPIPAATAAPASIPSSNPDPPPSSASRKPTLVPARPPAVLAALPARADAFISHLQRCLATPSGTDTLLLFLCYASRLTGALATSLSHALLHRKLLTLALTLPRTPATTTTSTVLLTTSAPPLTPPRAALAALAALLGARLKALGALASEARTITRLWALLGMYSWAKRLILTPSSSAAATAIDWTQLAACTAFQALENGAYLSAKGVLGWTPAQQGRAYVVASRWLALYTGLEIGKLLAKMLAPPASGDAEEGAARAEREAVRRSMAINLAWTPLTVHWAAETGFLSDLAVGLGGSVPGVLQMRKLWKDTAQ